MYYSKSTDNPWPGSKDNSQWINTIIIIINTYHSLSILDIKSFYTIDSRSFLWKRQFLDILVAGSRSDYLQSGQQCTGIMTAWLSCHWHRVLRHFDSRMLRNQNFEIVFGRESDLSVFRLFDFWGFFFTFPFFPFLFAAVIYLLLGLLTVKKF